MTDLKKLSVSLTKHGAHKIADVLARVDVDQVLASTWNVLPGVNIDLAQAKKTLSVSRSGLLPSFWVSAKERGGQSINSLVLLGIIFSHWFLIGVMGDRSSGFGQGTIHRDDFQGNIKGFTNLKDDFRELGFLTTEDISRFSFDMRSILQNAELGPLALSLFRTKLVEAGWDGKNDVIDECIAQGFHSSLGMSDEAFRSWLAGDASDLDAIPDVEDPDEAPAYNLRFVAGHRERRIGEVEKCGHGKTKAARLIHNDLQTKLFNFLAALNGQKNVGSENRATAARGGVDLVLKTEDGFTFFEIKTSPSLRKCIREALPQLLEYCCWPKECRSKELVIVSTNKPTKDAKNYLAHLREMFSIPIYHETIDRLTGALSDRI